MNPFIELGVSAELVAAVEAMGFVQPTPIQEKSIPVLLSADRDFVGLASTGTGKTAAFGLPLLQSIDLGEKRIQGLVLAPTRELCNQIARDLENFSANIPGLHVVAVYGGASIDTQIRALKRGAHIVVATPGRLIDLLDRGALSIGNVEVVVLDEADEMLNMGFKEDIDTILENVWNDEHRTWLFSATMPAGVKAIAQNFMDNPFELTVGTKNAANTNIAHEYYLVRARDRYETLKRIADLHPDIFGIVFTRTKVEAQEVAEKLIRDGYDADALHGDLSQAQRDKVMTRFREKSLQMLIATDVAARGIDVDNVSHVINYGLPDELEVYTHRSGRTGRAGKSGISISIVHSKEQGRIRQLEKFIKATILKKEIPTGEQICERQLFHLVERVHQVEVNEDQIAAYLPHIFHELNDLSREDIIKRFVSIEFNRFLAYYSGARDLNTQGGEGRGEGREDGRRTMERLFVSIGELDGVDKQGLLKLVNSLKLGRIEIGRIEIKRSYSFLQVESSMVEEFLEAVNSTEYSGRQLRAERSGDRPVKEKRSFRKPRGEGSGGGFRKKDGFGDAKKSFSKKPKQKQSDDSWNWEKPKGGGKKPKRF